MLKVFIFLKVEVSNQWPRRPKLLQHSQLKLSAKSPQGDQEK